MFHQHFYNKHKEEEHIRCGLALFSFEDEDEWFINNGCSHQMTGDKSNMKCLRKSQDDKVILGNSSLAKFLGKGRAKINKFIREVDSLLLKG